MQVPQARRIFHRGGENWHIGNCAILEAQDAPWVNRCGPGRYRVRSGSIDEHRRSLQMPGDLIQQLCGLESTLMLMIS
jgi:hypothetical protein